MHVAKITAGPAIPAATPILTKTPVPRIDPKPIMIAPKSPTRCCRRATSRGSGASVILPIKPYCCRIAMPYDPSLENAYRPSSSTIVTELQSHEHRSSSFRNGHPDNFHGWISRIGGNFPIGFLQIERCPNRKIGGDFRDRHDIRQSGQSAKNKYHLFPVFFHPWKIRQVRIFWIESECVSGQVWKPVSKRISRRSAHSHIPTFRKSES